MSKISKILPTSICGKILALVLTISNITLIVLITMLFMFSGNIELTNTLEYPEYTESVPVTSNDSDTVYSDSELYYDLILRGYTQNIIKTGEKRSLE